ncbi:MAG: hypothetical protein ACKV0T_13170 [Planctomycetales bacterium]
MADGVANSLDSKWRRLIETIHQSPQQFVIVLTGGGASAVAQLLVVPGGSRTILEATIPYSAAALANWLGKTPEQYCAEETALAMATVAYERGERLSGRARAEGGLSRSAAAPLPEEVSGDAIAGIACTAALVSDRPKKGDHRCFVAVQTAGSTSCVALVLDKGARDRMGEEQLVGQVVLLEAARAAGIPTASCPPLALRPGEVVDSHRQEAAALLKELRLGNRRLVWSLPAEGLAIELASPEHQIPTPKGVLCGAFNPLHFGHEALRDVAEQLLGGPVYYELSLHNVDKPPLDYLTIERRRAQFTSQPLALTMAPTFAEKGEVLPGVTFVVGADTAERIVQPRYYGDSEAAMHAALSRIAEQGCRFLVAGRQSGERFVTLADVPLPGPYARLFAAIPPDLFRADVSSTQLRQA